MNKLKEAYCLPKINIVVTSKLIDLNRETFSQIFYYTSDVII